MRQALLFIGIPIYLHKYKKNVLTMRNNKKRVKKTNFNIFL